jgi:hypothetical protein
VESARGVLSSAPCNSWGQQQHPQGEAMSMFKRLALVLAIVLLAGCAGMTEITDFSDRSVGYGWVDIKDAAPNSISSIYVQQYRPKTSEPYYSMAFEEYKGGILFWTTGLAIGSHKIDTVRGQRCLGFLCGNTIYTYNFGKQGDEVGAVVIKTPGAYHLGSYKLQDVKTGWFEEGKFEVLPAPNAPSRREMLEEILKQTKNDIMADRIRRELARL